MYTPVETNASNGVYRYPIEFAIKVKGQLVSLTDLVRSLTNLPCSEGGCIKPPTIPVDTK